MMSDHSSILYRGTLSSCNYGCEYCPFAKRVDSRAQLAEDARALRRFIDWVRERHAPTSVLFTPWGEALIRRPYREALIALTNLEHVPRAAIQTNLSVDLGWVSSCDPTRLGIWATFHPDWANRDAFVERVRTLHARGVHVSAGVVGVRESFATIEALRRELPDDVYMWVNAYKRIPGYYSLDEVVWLESVDPLFSINNRYHPSRGRSCRAGHTAISVDSDGNARRCHFIPDVIGNIYDAEFESQLDARACTNRTCGCHIGYVHLEYLQLDSVFGPGILERVPSERPSRQSAHSLQLVGDSA